MRIGKLRRKLKEKKFLEKQYDRLTNKAHEMNDFERFECSTFFRGFERAEYNQRKYNKTMKRLTRQIDFIKRLLNIE